MGKLKILFASSEVAPFVKRLANDFETLVRYDISPKTSASLRYGQQIQNYITSSFKGYSYIQHDIAPVFYYHLSPKISLTAEYDLGIIDYTGGANYNSLYNQVRGGIEGRLTPKSTVYLRAGGQMRTYKTSTMKNAPDFVMQGIYDYQISPKTALELIAASDIVESVYADAGYYRSYNFYASLIHHIRYNLDLNLNGFYLRSNYPHDAQVGLEWRKRYDNLYGVGTQLNYRFRTWISAFAGYDYKLRDSNVRDFQYNDSIVSGGVNVSF